MLVGRTPFWLWEVTGIKQISIPMRLPEVATRVHEVSGYGGAAASQRQD